MINFKKLSGVLAASVLITGAVQAADIVVEEVVEEVVVVPSSSWDGLYVGVHGGYAWTNTTVSVTPALAPTFPTQVDPDGILGGVQVGYNYQYNDLVFGVVGDIAATGMDATGNLRAGPIPTSFETEYDWIATVRGRVGWLLNDRTLLYGHGGLAITDMSTDFTSVAGFLNGLSVGGTETGWVAGAGVEAAFSDRISVFAEYSYIDFNNNESFTGPLLSYTVDNDPINSVKIGINFKLWQPAN